ncbi:hypothetical protein [Nonomuraea lactucae]|uniref:hypothetical protein n=1 Tax=Nonomuraea lactucae TaxID=2249762 RepID=UPI0013B3E342|nr:hypothetical protein [Nonomuraea lactucae]
MIDDETPGARPLLRRPEDGELIDVAGAGPGHLLAAVRGTPHGFRHRTSSFRPDATAAQPRQSSRNPLRNGLRGGNFTM